MYSKKPIAIIISLIIILTLFNLPQNSHYLYAQSLEEELQDIINQREETQKKIEEVEKIEEQYVDEVSRVEDDLLVVLSELDELNKILSETKSKADKITIELILKEEELEQIETELPRMVDVLNDRAEAIYKNNSGNILELLLNSKDF